MHQLAPQATLLDTLVAELEPEAVSYPLIDSVIEATIAAQPKKKKRIFVLCACQDPSCYCSGWQDA